MGSMSDQKDMANIKIGHGSISLRGGFPDESSLQPPHPIYVG